MRPVGASTENILAKTDQAVQRTLEEFIPLLRENWKHIDAGTRNALLQGLAEDA
jgi:hypothetical protein